MNKIVSKELFSENVVKFEIEAPRIAKARRAGHFVIVRVDENGERIPLTIAGSNLEKGTITLVVQRIGVSTHKLFNLNVGDCVADVVGPLGKATKIEKQANTVLCCGGGVGVAPLLPIIKAMKAAGNKVTIIMGARNESLFLMKDEMTALADNIIFMTDDGSYGRKGLVTEPLKELCEDTKGKPDMVIAIGPPIMMKFCALTTKPYGVKTVVSLNSIMVDGTGMCGGCRVTIGGKTKFVCVDGPEFDGHEVDWNNMLQRMGAFKPQEQESLHRFGANDGHKCNIDKMADAKAKESK